GTYTGENSRGIYMSQLDPAPGALTPAEVVAEVKNPSFLAIHPNRKFLYAVSEVDIAGGKPTGGVSGFAMDAKSGKLKLLNQKQSKGAGPCHLVVDKAGRTALFANSGGGSCAVRPIYPDGKLGDATAASQHAGKRVVAGRQDGPPAHS